MARPVYHVVWDLSRDNIRTDTLLQTDYCDCVRYDYSLHCSRSLSLFAGYTASLSAISYHELFTIWPFDANFTVSLAPFPTRTWCYRVQMQRFCNIYFVLRSVILSQYRERPLI